MIDRYVDVKIQNIWNSINKYKLWLQVELDVCEAQGALGIIPKDVSKNIKDVLQHNLLQEDFGWDAFVTLLRNAEKDVRHEFLAFLLVLKQFVNIEDARFIHFGLTSSDVLDTVYSLQCKQSLEIIDSQLDNLMKVLKDKANKYKDTPCIGRTHGMHAEPTSFGLKFLLAYSECDRQRGRIHNIRDQELVFSISGTVGTYSSVPDEVEQMVAKKLKLPIAPVATQIVPRDYYSTVFFGLANLAAIIERQATEIRNLQRSEIDEVSESFGEKQGGSSAMSHKRNPILSESVTGLCRVIRSYVAPALEDVNLSHERDMSHSSVERINTPTAFSLAAFVLNRMYYVFDNLVVKTDNMLKNLNQFKKLWYSHKLLLKLVAAGKTREEAYKIVHDISSAATEKCDFVCTAEKDPKVTEVLSKSDLEETFLPVEKYLENVDLIYKRVLESK